MNIFVLDEHPYAAAKYHCDKHVVKMLLESAQMLCTVNRRYGLYAPYKPVHQKHPCTLWVGESVQNYSWMILLTHALQQQYAIRYGKVHKSYEAVMKLSADEIYRRLPDIGMTPFAQAMPDQYKHHDPVVAYRLYYVMEKAKFAQWNHGDTPQWYKEAMAV